MRFKVFILGILVFALFACQKENDRIDYNNGIESAKTYVAAQQMMTQLLNTYFKCLTDSALITTGKSVIDAADVYYYNEPEESILISYPYWGKDDGYGHYRINPYEVVPRTSFADPNVTVDIIFHDFLFDKDTLYVQNLTVTSLGKTDGINEHYRAMADKVEMIYKDTTGFTSFSFDQEYVRIKDQNTIYTSPDDYFRINGNLSGETKGNLNYNAMIDTDSALLFSLSCRWIKGGVVAVETIPFNYSSYVYFPEQDTCLNEYNIMINGDPFPYPIDM